MTDPITAAGRRWVSALAGAALAVAGPAVAATAADVAGPATAASVHRLPTTDCTAFPADNVWHADIRHLPLEPHSAAWVDTIGRNADLHPDFGPSYGAQPVPYGIPITYVDGSHRKVRVRFRYSSESDHVRYPLGPDTKIEGGRHARGDRHAVIVDRATCWLYETFDTPATPRRGGRPARAPPGR